MEAFWLLVTDLGRDEVFIVAIALYTLLVDPLGGRRLGLLFALSYLVNTALKYGLNLPRPFTADPAVASEAARATAGGPGLPSGHAQLSATLWGGMAAQRRQPGLVVAALVLIGLIAASRLALHVHFVSDVIVGLLLGGLFAWGAGAARFPAALADPAPALRWGLPAALLLALALWPVPVTREYSAGLGILAGFWAARPQFVPPRDWTGRLIVGALGLLITFAAYFALGALPGASLPAVRALRYAALVLVVAQVVPALLRRWLPLAPAQPSPVPMPQAGR